MLKKFKVSNFKCFNEELTFDLSSVDDYTFNTECVIDGIVNNSIIYGHNGCGKSNLGWAIFDIIEHLTDKTRNTDPYIHYTNALNESHVAEFEYEFVFGESRLTYRYSKSDYRTIVSEQLIIDDALIVDFDRRDGNTTFNCHFPGTESLKKSINDPSLSVLKYIRNNSNLDDSPLNSTFKEFFSFVERMLFFRSLEDRTYLGQELKQGSLTDHIIKAGKVEDFEAFLHEANVDSKLAVVNNLGKKTIAFDFGKEKICIYDIMSTGTSSLMLFYCWFMQMQNREMSFVFIDEFDAFYHHELSKLIVRKLKESGVQFVLTTHNTSIMSNDLLRPDCYYLMNSHKILPLSQCTEKELREAHNIERIYKSGAFNVD